MRPSVAHIEIRGVFKELFERLPFSQNRRVGLLRILVGRMTLYPELEAILAFTLADSDLSARILDCRSIQFSIMS